MHPWLLEEAISRRKSPRLWIPLRARLWRRRGSAISERVFDPEGGLRAVIPDKCGWLCTAMNGAKVQWKW